MRMHVQYWKPTLPRVRIPQQVNSHYTHSLLPLTVQQNELIESKIQRRPSRTTSKKPDKLLVPGPSLPIVAPGSAVFGITLGSVPLSTSLGPSSSHGPQIFLRIRVADAADAVHISTTIPVYVSCFRANVIHIHFLLG